MKKSRWCLVGPIPARWRRGERDGWRPNLGMFIRENCYSFLFFVLGYFVVYLRGLLPIYLMRFFYFSLFFMDFLGRKFAWILIIIILNLNIKRADLYFVVQGWCFKLIKNVCPALFQFFLIIFFYNSFSLGICRVFFVVFFFLAIDLRILINWNVKNEREGW